MEIACFMNLLLLPFTSATPAMPEFLLSSKILSLIQASVTKPYQLSDRNVGKRYVDTKLRSLCLYHRKMDTSAPV